MSAFSAFMRSLRPKQWIKNLILYAGWLFSLGERTFSLQRELMLFGQVTYGFVAFCLLSSAIYLLNDIIDRDADREHPAKRNRPIASGALSLSFAGLASFLLFAGGTSLAFLFNAYFGALAAVYFVMFVFYSLIFKRIIILDSMVIATGFVLRAIAGAVIVSVGISVWLIVCTIFLALFLGFAKRRSELVTLQSDAAVHRRILAQYSLGLLDLLLGICCTLAVISYSLYSITRHAQSTLGPDVLITLPFVFFGVFRYLYLVVQENRGSDPASVLLSDPPLLVTVILWITISAVLLVSRPGLLGGIVTH